MITSQKKCGHPTRQTLIILTITSTFPHYEWFPKNLRYPSNVQYQSRPFDASIPTIPVPHWKLSLRLKAITSDKHVIQPDFVSIHLVVCKMWSFLLQSSMCSQIPYATCTLIFKLRRFFFIFIKFILIKWNWVITSSFNLSNRLNFVFISSFKTQSFRILCWSWLRLMNVFWAIFLWINSIA